MWLSLSAESCHVWQFSLPLMTIQQSTWRFFSVWNHTNSFYTKYNFPSEIIVTGRTSVLLLLKKSYDPRNIRGLLSGMQICKLWLLGPSKQWSLNKMADILQTIFSRAFSWTKLIKCCILIQIWLKFVLKNTVDNKSSSVHVMAWHQA